MLEILTEHSNTTVFLATCTVVVQFNSPNREAEYCDEPVCLSVCLSVYVCVCLFVCLRSYLQNYTSDLHPFFYARYLWPWLSPVLAA